MKIITNYGSFLNENKFYAYYIEDKGERPYALTQDAIWLDFDTEEERDEFVKKVKKDKKYKNIKIKYVEKSSKKQKENAYYDREPHIETAEEENKRRKKDGESAHKYRKAESKNKK